MGCACRCGYDVYCVSFGVGLVVCSMAIFYSRPCFWKRNTHRRLEKKLAADAWTVSGTRDSSGRLLARCICVIFRNDLADKSCGLTAARRYRPYAKGCGTDGNRDAGYCGYCRYHVVDHRQNSACDVDGKLLPRDDRAGAKAKGIGPGDKKNFTRGYKKNRLARCRYSINYRDFSWDHFARTHQYPTNDRGHGTPRQ